MAKPVIQSQNIVKATPKFLRASNPDVYWLNPSLVNVIDDGAALYSQYYPSAYSLLDNNVVPNPVIPKPDPVDPLPSDFPGLADIESINGTIYKDANGNKKVKYVIKVRNGYGTNAVGVDARIFDQYA